MPRTRILLDYSRCEPEECPDGFCLAAEACERNVLRQEEAGDLPDLYLGSCLGCQDCLPVCPRQALRLED